MRDATPSAGRRSDAESQLLRTLDLDSADTQAMLGMAVMYEQSGRASNWLKYALMLERTGAAPPEILAQLAAYYSGRGEHEQATALLRSAFDRGLDSTSLQHLLQAYPHLRQYFMEPETLPETDTIEKRQES